MTSPSHSKGTTPACAQPEDRKPGIDVFVGEGEMVSLMRQMDWSTTPIGAVQSWPQSLRTTLSICLDSRFPILIWWGPELVMLYNDAYRPILGTTKHPTALGQRGQSCWPEIWDIIGPMLTGVLTDGKATWSADQLLMLERNGYPEECYFTFSYSPIRDESGGVSGVFTAVTETTERVLGERRVRTLRDLADRAGEARSASEACAIAAEKLAGNQADILFALLYLLDSTGRQAQLVGTMGLAPGTPASPATVDLTTADTQARAWPFKEVIKSGAPIILENVSERFGALPSGPWEAPPHTAIIIPITRANQERPYGLMLAGINPHRRLDDDYHGFLDLAAGHIATAVANAQAYEEERQRADALAALNQAKTTFFNNVSHEFRTPLTLLLAPLEDMLAEVGAPLPPPYREPLDIAYRNALRLLKLVNTLLDFSRIEAGRVQASYEAVDLAILTAELASWFRAAVERAGLQFVVDCPPLPEPVYVDSDMWEKIVLNLLSNAFKFTFTGHIAVVLRWADDHVELKVEDTGAGIAAHELPHIFERFHRVPEAQARTYEGSGIGLSLVQELAGLHGGEIEVASRVGHGTTFTVSLPTGSAHLPAEHIGAARTLASTALGASPFVEEALRWLDQDEPQSASSVVPSTGLNREGVFLQEPLDANARPEPRQRVLLADDNADMRAYIARLLRVHYEVVAVANGKQALAAAHAHPPDLVLTDIMMPELDGFALLQALRADPATRTIPVILLSARAGEEARVEGLEAGADDYLVKPFPARELVARVRTHLEMARLLKETETILRQHNETLEQHVAERTAELERQQTALAQREKLAAMGSLLASVAHELNNPLAAVMAQADLLCEELGPHPLREQAAEIIQAAERCVGIVRNFLTLAHQHTPQRTRVEFNTLIREAMKLLSYPLQVDTIDVRQHLANDLPPLWADPHQLHQVIVNLITNAHQALRETTEPRRLTLRTRAEPNPERVLFEVADTGPGISSAVQARMFEPFFTTKPSGVGTGLGLPFCRGIVEEHGGVLDVESQPGQGAVFRVELPVPAIPPQFGTVAKPEAPEPGDGKTILIVDDEAGIRRPLARLLRRDGYRVETASNGREALEKCLAQAFDLILSDLRMPELDGPGFYRELVCHSPHLGQRVLFLTGDTLSPEVDAFLADIGAPRLTKPFTTALARRTIRQMLTQRSPGN